MNPIKNVIASQRPPAEQVASIFGQRPKRQEDVSALIVELAIPPRQGFVWQGQITMTKARIKMFLFALWGTVVCLAIYTYFSREYSISGTAGTVRDFIRQSGVWGPLIYVSGYAFRSLIFFPASILTVTAGILFGPWLGILLTLIGENISANISFVVGRYFTADLLKYLSTNKLFVPRLTCKIQNNGFLTVLVMRLMFLPFDLVGYSSGMCNIKQRDFALATVIGTIPGLLTFVFLGGSLLDFRYLILAAAFLTFGLAVSFWLKKSFLIGNPIKNHETG